jgi:hypothetical protein
LPACSAPGIPDEDGIIDRRFIIEGDKKQGRRIGLEQGLLPDLLIVNQPGLKDLVDRDIFPWSEENLKTGQRISQGNSLTGTPPPTRQPPPSLFKKYTRGNFP